MREAPSGRLQTRLLLGTLGPTVLALAVFGVLAHESARRVLDDELGKRLALAAVGTAGMVLPEQVAALAADEAAPPDGTARGESLTLANVRRRLAVARERFEVRRALVVSAKPGASGFVARVDTDGRIVPGSAASEVGRSSSDTTGCRTSAATPRSDRPRWWASRWWRRAPTI